MYSMQFRGWNDECQGLESVTLLWEKETKRVQNQNGYNSLREILKGEVSLYRRPPV